MEMNKIPLKVAIYARVSTEEQHVDQQLAYLKEYASKSGLEVVRICTDEESGRLPLSERVKFKRLLDDSLKGSFQAIVVYKLDRLTRNWYDEAFIEKHFVDNWEKCKLIVASDEVDLASAGGRAMFRMRFVFACFEPEITRERMVLGIARAKAEGRYKGGKVGRKIPNR